MLVGSVIITVISTSVVVEVDMSGAASTASPGPRISGREAKARTRRILKLDIGSYTVS